MKIGDIMIGFDDSQEPDGFDSVGIDSMMKNLRGHRGVITRIDSRIVYVKFEYNNKTRTYLYQRPYVEKYILQSIEVGDFVIAYNGEDALDNKIIGIVEDIDDDGLVCVGDAWYKNYKIINKEELLNFINNEQIYNRI